MSSRLKEKSKSDSKKHKSSQNYDDDSMTPPLPINTDSIKDLIKQRELLRQQLKKYSEVKEHKDQSYKDEKNKERKLSDRYSSHYSRKASNSHSYDKSNKKTKPRERSPEYSEKVLESEDEEDIIERRRKERKRLIEKLKDKQANSKNENNCNNTDIIKKYKQENNEESETSTVEKVTDMFSDNDNFTNSFGKITKNVIQDSHADNWDDSEGYYKIREGDSIDSNRYVIKNIVGQGVFANVVKALDSIKSNKEVAIKIIRNNDLMYKTGLREINTLKTVADADPDNKSHCVKILRHFMYKSHLCIVLESLYMDLRGVLKKYGKSQGINMNALTNYSRQLLLAVRLLKKLGIIHADIKPDNILINEKKNILKLCDFGSAIREADNEPTPYLVSRFYRAPEIILGLPYTCSVDIWSTACTIYEIGTGKILFTGNSNNKMLKYFMDIKGKFPNRLIKKGKFKDQHFNYNNNFLLHKKDEISGRDKVVEIVDTNPTRDLLKELKKYCKNLTEVEEKKLPLLKDMLDKMLTLDPNQRIHASDCLKHQFLKEDNNRK